MAKKVANLVVKTYNEQDTINAYYRRFKERRSDDALINKIKDYLYDNLKTIHQPSGKEFLDLLGNTRFEAIANHFNKKTEFNINEVGVPMVKLRDCVDIQDFMILAVNVQNAWLIVSSRDTIDTTTRVISGLKDIFGADSRTYAKMEKVLIRKKTLFESLFTDPIAEGAYGYQVTFNDIRKSIT